MPQYFGKLPTTSQPWTTLGSIDSIEVSDRHIHLHCGDAQLCLSILSPRLVRVRLAPTGTFLPRRSWAVAIEDEAWQQTAFTHEQTNDAIQIVTSDIRIEIQRHPCRIQCFDRAGQAFAQDTETGMGWRRGAIAAWKQIETEEHFYGFGERTGLLDHRSEVLTNWTVDAVDYNATTDEMYQAIPFFMALRPSLCYGVFFNTTYWSQFDIGAEQMGVWRMESHSPELDYYIIYGDNPAAILETYTQLTGRMPLPPKWALGYHQCRWSYESEAVVRQIAQKFRTRQIPCDVIHLDIDYMQGFRVFTWNKKRFPYPQKLISDLTQQGFKVTTIVDPGVKYEPDGDYAVYDEGLEKDCFIRSKAGNLFHGYVWPDKAVFPDFLRAEVRHWWAEWHRILTDVGVAGIWNDMNEPALDDRPFGDEGDKIWFPLDAPQGDTVENATHAETHNLYGLMMAQTSYQAMSRLRGNQRSFVLTRSGYAGIQRWSAVWTGDNQSLWEHLEQSLPMLCNLGLSGVAFVGADIGGFAGNATAELFARWMQVGMLYPFMRAHSALSSARHEPWVFGDRTEKICREYIELRYQLLPYIYTLFWQSTTQGSPVLRPLLYHYPNDPKTYQLHDQVLLGEALMAAPVYRPGVECRAVYLPEGTWYDWWTGDRYEGGKYILADAPLERMPLYVKAGAIIPMQPVMSSVDAQPWNLLRLKVWAGTGEFTLYEDDGQTFDYRNGAWSTQTYRVQQIDDEAIVSVAARQGQWQPEPRTVSIELVGVDEQQFTDDVNTNATEFRFRLTN